MILGFPWFIYKCLRIIFKNCKNSSQKILGWAIKANDDVDDD